MSATPRSVGPTAKIRTLGQVFDGPHATPETVDQGPLFLGISSLVNGRIALGETRHVTEEDFVKWTRRVEPTEGDLVFSYETRIGEAALIPKGMRCCLGRRMALWRIDRAQLEPQFALYAYISPSFQRFLASKTVHGATVDRLLLTDFPDFEFPLPPLAEQRAIAAVLGALDDKIEANRRMNATLEALARALFKSWFVDFDPVRAKMEGRAPALAPDLAALFPVRLTDSPLGPIPEGWEVQTLGNIVAGGRGEIRTGPFGSQLHQSDYTVDGTPVVMPANLIDGTIDVSRIARIGEADVQRLSDHQLRVGDIVYGRRGDIGRKALVGQTEVGWLCGTGCLRIRCDVARCPPLFLFQFLGLDVVREWIATRAVGATMPNLNTGILGEVEVLLPSEPVAQAFVAVAEPLDSAMRVRRQQSRTLAQLRDLLLPKLLSGALRVRDAERMIGDAA